MHAYYTNTCEHNATLVKIGFTAYSISPYLMITLKKIGFHDILIGDPRYCGLEDKNDVIVTLVFMLFQM